MLEEDNHWVIIPRSSNTDAYNSGILGLPKDLSTQSLAAPLITVSAKEYLNFGPFSSFFLRFQLHHDFTQNAII